MLPQQHHNSCLPFVLPASSRSRPKGSESYWSTVPEADYHLRELCHLHFLANVFVCACTLTFVRYLDKAAIRSDSLAVSVTEVEETKAFLGILPLFLCICIYQMTYGAEG